MLLVGGSRKFVSDSAQPDATDRTVAAATTPSSYSSESLLAGPQLYHCRYLRPGRSCAPAFANYVNSRKMGFPETGFSAQRRVPKTRRDRNLAPAMRDWLTKSEKDPWAIGTIVGVNLIVSGFTRLMYSVAARKTIKAVP